MNATAQATEPKVILRLESTSGEKFYLFEKCGPDRQLHVHAANIAGEIFFSVEHIDTADARLILRDLMYSLKRAADAKWGNS